MNIRPKHRPDAGFTLLELVFAVGLMAIISGMVFGIARTSLGLASSIVSSQNKEMEHHAFFDLLGRFFPALPANTRFELLSEDSGSHYLSDMTFQNVPMAFTWGGEEKIAKTIRISTVKRRSGFLDIVLSYYENEILEGSESQMGQSSVLDEKPFAEIVLLTDVAYFEWRVLDGRSMEWQYDWDIQGRLPIQVELIMAIGADGPEMRQVFWIPPKQNPQARMQQLQNVGNGGAGGGAGGPINPNPGGNGNPVNIPVNPAPGGFQNPGQGQGGQPAPPLNRR